LRYSVTNNNEADMATVAVHRQPRNPLRRSRPRSTDYVVRLRPKPGIDGVYALRGALKVLGRRFGLRAVWVEEAR
jgi:hypothetical protein